jgi:multidrug resistance efflux pump
MSFSCSKLKNEDSSDQNAGRKIVETGELAAINTKSFPLPRFGNYWSQMKIIGVLKHGAIVKPGDSIIQLDATEVKKYIIERETQLETQQAVITKLRVNQENRRQDLDSRVQNENSAFNLKKLELESSRFESERIKKIKGLEFEQEKIVLAKVKKILVLSKTIDANEMKVEQIKVNQLKNEIRSGYAILPLLTIRTPISGIFQIGNNEQTGEGIKIGDNIYTGNNLGNVPDIKWMKVNTTISEKDFLKIRTGQKVKVRLDALPKVSFMGEVAYIEKLCHLKNPKSRQKVFEVEVKIIKPDERLKPGMTVSCEFI